MLNADRDAPSFLTDPLIASPRDVRGGDELRLATLTARVPPGDWVARWEVGATRRWVVQRSVDASSTAELRLLEGGSPARDDAELRARLDVAGLLPDGAALTEQAVVSGGPLGARSATSTIRALIPVSGERAPLRLAMRICSFVPASQPDTTSVVVYAASGALADSFDDDARVAFEGVESLPNGERRVPPGERGLWKLHETGLARRSLTLPKARVSVVARAGRDPAADGGVAAMAASIGLTDRLELSLPGIVTYALGDPEVGTEIAVGGGLTELGFASYGSRVSAGLGATLAARRRFSADAALIARATADGIRPADGARRLELAAGAGVVWDVHPLLSLGLGASYRTALRERDGRSEALYLGGAAVPLVSVHLGTVDLDLKPAAVVHEHGVGAALQIGLGAVF